MYVLGYVTVFNKLKHTFGRQLALVYVLFRLLDAYSVNLALTHLYLTFLISS